MAEYPYGVPDQEPTRIRPQFRSAGKFGFPWLGVDNTPLGLKKLAQMPGVVGIIDPSTLKTVAGIGQTIRCVVSGAVYAAAAGTCTLVARGKGRMMNSTGNAGFKPDLQTGIVMPQDRWTAMFTIAPDSASTGIGYLFSKVVADANEGRPDFSIGMNTLKICEFDHSPGVSSQIISDYVFAANDFKVVTISQSPEYGMTLSINGVVNKLAPTRIEGLSSVAAERMFQVGDYSAVSSLGYKGMLGWSMFCAGDYHDPRYAEPLARSVAAMKDFYAIA
ncbi:hypothetical protein [Rhizobium herbae]